MSGLLCSSSSLIADLFSVLFNDDFTCSLFRIDSIPSQLFINLTGLTLVDVSNNNLGMFQSSLIKNKSTYSLNYSLHPRDNPSPAEASHSATDFNHE